ncbi:MAG: ribonuclease E/G, partial [Alphaproteobacteria bacterium]|nr:ribonuclease E/G [Alphaproteobacteria bacterium]
TEALVAIDVNSGKSTRERHIEETALKTNLEAADEVARQLRLRDLAGLIVIDFIDMDENRNDAAVERRLKEALRRDRARIQVGRISSFGLMEMSRQRLRPSLIEAMSQPCPTCGGVGYIVSTESAALMVTRAIEEECLRRRATQVTAKVPGSVALYVLNHKRASLMEMESRYGITVTLEAVDGMLPPHYELTRSGTGEGEEGAEQVVERAPDRPIDRSGESSSPAPRNNERPPRPAAEGNEDRTGRKRSRRGGRRRGRRDDESADATAEDQNALANTEAEDEDNAVAESNTEATGQDNQANTAEGGEGEDKTRRRRKRGRRGGRRRNRGGADGQNTEGQNGDGQSNGASNTSVNDNEGEGENNAPVAASADTGNDTTEQSRPSRRGRGRGRKPAAETTSDSGPQSDAQQSGEPKAETSQESVSDSAANDGVAVGVDAPEAEAKVKPARRSRKKAAAAKPEAADAVDAAPEDAQPAKPAKRTRKKAAPAKPKAAKPEAVATEAVVQYTAPTPPPEPAKDQVMAAENEGMEKSVVLPAPEPVVEEGPPKAKKRGWWNKVIG